MDSLEIVYVPITALKPYENNAKIHSDFDVDAIAQSIQEFGFNDPVGICGENNLIIEGHGRVLAAKKIGMKEIPCIRLDSLTDEQRKAYALVHNKLTTNTGFDIAKLLEELDKIEEIDMNKYGFTDFKSIDEDLEDFFTPTPEEELPEQPEQPKPEALIKFTITPKDKVYILIDFLTENEIDYVEC